MKKPIRFGAVVKCDKPGCKNSFTTYSEYRLARSQALAAGWTRPRLRAMDGWEDWGLGESHSRKVDICPDCKPPPRMSGVKAA